MGFTRQEYWSRKPPPSPGDFPNPGIELGSPAGQADSLPSEPPGKPKMKGTFDGESTQLGAAISFQSASAPHTDHCREISAGEDDDNPGKRAPKPLVHRTELRGSRCPRVVTWRGVTHCPSGLRVTVGCQAAAMAEQPSRGTADPGAFRARASCSPWGKETKLWRVTGSGCSRRHAEHKDWRSPVRGPRKGRGVGVGVTHWSLEPSGWRWKQCPLQLQKGRKRPGISGCREPEALDHMEFLSSAWAGSLPTKLPLPGSFCGIIHTAFRSGDSCKGETQGPGLENEGSLPHMPPWNPKLEAEPLPPLWGTSDGLPATPSARRESLRASTQWSQQWGWDQDMTQRRARALRYEGWNVIVLGPFPGTPLTRESPKIP